MITQTFGAQSSATVGQRRRYFTEQTGNPEQSVGRGESSRLVVGHCSRRAVLRWVKGTGKVLGCHQVLVCVEHALPFIFSCKLSVERAEPRWVPLERHALEEPTSSSTGTQLSEANCR